MKVVGTGVDLVELSRFKQAIKRRGDRFLKKLFTPKELAYAKSRKQMVQHLAVRFAAKEAVVKALGAPKGLGLEWTDVEISHASSGQPKVLLRGSMRRWIKLNIHVSLTHTKEYAVATAFACSR